MFEHLEKLNGFARGVSDRTDTSYSSAQISLTQRILDGACGDTGGWSSHVQAARRRTTRSYAPYEWAALTREQRSKLSKHQTQCICSKCGASCGFDIELGRANELQSGGSAMFGASNFVDHEVSLAVLMAEELLDTHGWRGAVTIPRRHCCAFEAALSGSAARSEETALATWQLELDLNSVAARAAANAIRLPFLEPAPELLVETCSGSESRMGKASVYIVLNKDDVLHSSRALRKLWYTALTPKLLEGYSPLVIDEDLALQIAASAVAHGEKGQAGDVRRAKKLVHQGQLMLAVVEAEPEMHKRAAVAAGRLQRQQGSVAGNVNVLREVLHSSGASHILLPNGASMNKQMEALATRSEAEALGVGAESLCAHFFNREGAASGVVDSDSAVELLGNSYHVISEAEGYWGKEVEFLAGTNSAQGVRTVAMSYIAGDKARARKRKQSSSGNDTQGSLPGDGPNQPRLLRIHNALRGVHIDGDALKELESNGDYMQQIRIVQMEAAADCLLTLRYHRYGGAALSNAANSPIAKASSTVARICKEQGSFKGACTYMAANTMASINLSHLSVHIDGAKASKGEPTAEMCTTRWADMLQGLSSPAKKARLAAARQLQPLLAMSLWLRRSVALDIAPCSGLAIVAGTEEEHGVPVPLPDDNGGDMERGLTRSVAQSLRPDDATQGDAPTFQDGQERRPGLRLRGRDNQAVPGEAAEVVAGVTQAAPGIQAAAGGGRKGRPKRSQKARAAPNRLVPGTNPPPMVPHFRQPGIVPPAQGWGRARINRRTAVGY